MPLTMSEKKERKRAMKFSCPPRAFKDAQEAWGWMPETDVSNVVSIHRLEGTMNSTERQIYLVSERHGTPYKGKLPMLHPHEFYAQLFCTHSNIERQKPLGTGKAIDFYVEDVHKQVALNHKDGIWGGKSAVYTMDLIRRFANRKRFLNLYGTLHQQTIRPHYNDIRIALRKKENIDTHDDDIMILSNLAHNYKLTDTEIAKWIRNTIKRIQKSQKRIRHIIKRIRKPTKRIRK